MPVSSPAAGTRQIANAARPVRIVAVTQSDPFFTGRFFDAFLREAEQQALDVVEIVLLPNFNESKLKLARRLYHFYGAIDFVRLLGRYAWSRVAETVGSPRSAEAVARAFGIPIRHLDSINDEAYLATLRQREIDVLLSVAAPQIFRRTALEAAPLVLNVHNGRLPQYRGMMPTFWAMLNDESEITITVHEMVAKLDAGRIVAEHQLPIAEGETAFELSSRAKVVAGREVARLLGLANTDRWPEPRAIDFADQAYYKFPTRADAERLRARGRRLL